MGIKLEDMIKGIYRQVEIHHVIINYTYVPHLWLQSESKVIKLRNDSFL